METVQFMNVAKDDALAWPKIARRTYPATTNDRVESTIVPFVCKSLGVNVTLLNVFNDRLGLPEGELTKSQELSGIEARCIRNPPRPQDMREEQRAIGAHTDFRSLVRPAILTETTILRVIGVGSRSSTVDLVLAQN